MTCHLTSRNLIRFVTILVSALLFVPGTAQAQSGGDGTQYNPYLLANTTDLTWFQQNYTMSTSSSAKYYKLVDNINMSSMSNWTPIGTKAAPFYGRFDGNKKTLSNLAVNLPGASNVGLFGYIGLRGKVEDLYIENSDFVGASNVGAIAGYLDNGTIEDCKVTGVSVDASGNYAGGAVGYNSLGTILNTQVVAVVTANQYAGGLVGYSTHGRLGGDKVLDGSAIETAGDYAGGLVGCNENISANLSDRTRGIIGYKENACTAAADVAGNNCVGGLVGWNKGIITSASSATAIVTAYAKTEGVCAGGLVGKNTALIAGASANSTFAGRIDMCGGLVGLNETTGSINAASAVNANSLTVYYGKTYYLGGLVGVNKGSIDNGCSASGSISANYDPDTSVAFTIGGLVGANEASINNSSSSVAVTGQAYVGGLVGWNKSAGTVTGSSATGATIGTDSRVGGLIGNNDGAVERCFATGAVSGDYCVGGLLGWNTSTKVKNCYAQGTVGTITCAGGLVGANRGFITTCYATGETTATGYPKESGGLIGIDNGTITNSYWDSTTTKISGGKTTAQMKMQSTYVGWDFANTWTIASGSYPTLAVGGSIKITISPTDAVTSGAKWSANGGATWNASGASVSNPAVGTHTVIFKDVDNWGTPAPITINMTKGKAATGSGTYEALGKLCINIVPWPAKNETKIYNPEIYVRKKDNKAAIDPNNPPVVNPDNYEELPKWSVDGGTTYYDSGMTVKVPVGKYYKITFKGVTGWTTAGSIYSGNAGTDGSIWCPANSTSTAKAGYRQQIGKIKASVTPTDAATKATWSVYLTDGWNQHTAAYESNHYLIKDASVVAPEQTVPVAAKYTCVFGDVKNYTTPDEMRSQAVTNGATKTVSAAYTVDTGSVKVTFTPQDAIDDGCKWSINGKSYVSGQVATGLSVGTKYEITFTAATGWVAPSKIRDVYVTKDQVLEKTATFTRGRATIQVNIAGGMPLDARWKIVDDPQGDIWRKSGDKVSQDVNSYTIEYQTVDGWKTPANKSVSLTNGQTSIVEAIYYPINGSGTEKKPYELTDIEMVQWIAGRAEDGVTTGVYFKLMNDIDASDTKNWNYDKNTGSYQGFLPIGMLDSDYQRFNGKFYGNNMKISNLFINRDANSVGLFSFTGTESEIYDLNVDEANITGASSVGALLGMNRGLVSHCCSHGFVSGQSGVGGLMGQNDGKMENCFSMCEVTGNVDAAGLIGSLQFNGEMEYCHAAGKVNGTKGLIGATVRGDYATSITRCYWDVYSTGQDLGMLEDGSEPETSLKGLTKEKSLAWSSYKEWNSGIWTNIEGVTHPYFSSQTDGSLKVTLTPAEAATAGARWSINGGKSWYTNDMRISLPVGVYKLEFKDAAGYATPDPQTVTILRDRENPVNKTGEYSQVTQGLKVTIEPEEVRDAEAKWSVDGGAKWNNSGSTLALNPGSYTVIYSSVEGWDTPNPTKITVAKDEVTESIGSYVEQVGALKVTITPPEIAAKGELWSIDDGANWHTSGYTIENLPVGEYTITFKDINGWVKPSDKKITVMKNETGNVTAIYTMISATLTGVVENGLPSAARWSIDGGETWNASGESLTVSVGTHTVTFEQIAGWVVTPVSQEVTLDRLESKTVTASYRPLGDGTSANPYQINQIEHLVWVGDQTADGLSSGTCYQMVADVDAAETLLWSDGAGFKPIGTSDAPFNGKFDGNNKKISNLTINYTSNNGVGLFGYVGASGSIKLLGINSSTIFGYNIVGGFVGTNYGTLTQCYLSDSTVYGSNAIGGIVGRNGGKLYNVYAEAVVEGTTLVGGLVGNNLPSGAINICYSAGRVMLTDSTGVAGGLVGKNEGGQVDNSYWDKDASGIAISDGGTSKTTAEMQTKGTFVDWDFVNIWTIINGNTYPYFQTVADSKLKVTLLPKEAEDAGARWSIDNGLTWDRSLTRTIPAGTYEITFRDVVGWETPQPTTVEVKKSTSDKDIQSVDGVYSPGSLTVNLVSKNDYDAYDAVTSGAMWKFVGGGVSSQNEWFESGATIKSLPTNTTYTISLKAVHGWNESEPFDVYLADTPTTSVVATGTYERALGVLQVVMSPDDVTTESKAQWSVDNGSTWYDSDTTIALPVETYTVTFKDVEGWNAPAHQSASIENGTITWVMGEYTREGILLVNILPDEVTTASNDAQWSIDGGANWNDSGTSLTLDVDEYTVTFKDVVGWDTPTMQSVSIENNKTVTTTGVYAERGLLQVKISGPAEAAWSIDGGMTWSQETEPVYLSVSSVYAITFKDVAGWTTPTPQNIRVAVDETRLVSVVYACAPQGAGTEGNPYQIMTLNHLVWLQDQTTTLGLTKDKYYLLMNDIDATDTLYWNDSWTTGPVREGFVPIGTDELAPFQGVFMGGGHVIENLFINRVNEPNVGLFGYIDFSASITDLGVGNVSISGDEAVGGLVGYNFGIVDGCYTTGTVTGAKNLGGLVGENANTVENCYSLCSVAGGETVGGLIGYNAEGSFISDCYAAGSVGGSANVGGLIGVGDAVAGAIVSCYWDKEASGISTSAGGTGKTTAEMKTKDTFQGWNFDTPWGMVNGLTRPYLKALSDMGSITVTLQPAEAVTSGAAWSINGGLDWNKSGESMSDVLATTYTVTFKALSGWDTPAAVDVVVEKDATATTTGVYVKQVGSLTVDLAPVAAVAAGAKWSIDGGATWHQSGTVVTDLKLQTYTVSFKPVAGWTTPANQDVTILKNDTVTVTGNYVQQFGSLKVNITPAEAVSAGAKWSIDGGKSWRNSGMTATNLPLATTYIISFKVVDSWGTPKPISVYLANETLVEDKGVYGLDIELVDGTFTKGITSALAPGETLDFKWTTVANAAVTSPFWCEIFPSKTGGFDQVRTGGTVTSSYKAPGVAATTTTLVPPFLVLNTLPDGVYTLMPSVNRATVSDGALAETDYANNWLSVAGKRLSIRNTKTANIDLRISDVAISYNPATPTKVGFSGTVTNAGTENLTKPGAWVEAFYGTLTAECVLMPQGTIGAGQNINTLAAGESTTFTLTGTVAAGVMNRAFAVVADSTNIVPETNKVNNSYVCYDPSILPPGKDNGIDLAITKMTVDASQLTPNAVKPGDKLKYSVTVTNKGTTTPSAPVYLELFASQDGGVSNVQGVTFCWSEQITAPALGATQTYSLEKTINSIGDGVYSLVAVVNRDGAGANPGDMTPLDNRCKFADGRVFLSTPAESGTRNIVWSEGPTFTQSGDKVTVSGTIKNIGNATTRAFWTEAFVGTMQEKTGYFYKDNATVFAGGINCTLKANEEKAITLTGTVPAGKVVGVLADSTDVVAETDETDNYDYSELMK